MDGKAENSRNGGVDKLDEVPPDDHDAVLGMFEEVEIFLPALDQLPLPPSRHTTGTCQRNAHQNENQERQDQAHRQGGPGSDLPPPVPGVHVQSKNSQHLAGSWIGNGHQGRNPYSPVVAQRPFHKRAGVVESGGQLFRRVAIKVPGPGVTLGRNRLVVDKEENPAIVRPAHQVEEPVSITGLPHGGKLLLEPLVARSIQVGRRAGKRSHMLRVDRPCHDGCLLQQALAQTGICPLHGPPRKKCTRADAQGHSHHADLLRGDLRGNPYHINPPRFCGSTGELCEKKTPGKRK